MIHVKTLHNEVRGIINRLNSDWDTGVNAIDIDDALNKSIDYIQQNHVRLAEYNKLLENIYDISLYFT